MSIFSKELAAKIEALKKTYETPRSAILPVFHAVQDECGCIGNEQLDALEHEFGFRRVELEETQTFYTMFRRTKGARHHVHCCDNVTCRMMGAEKIIARVEKQIAAFTATGFEAPFDLERVPCLGVCGEAPALLVDKERYTKVTENDIDALLGKYSHLEK